MRGRAAQRLALVAVAVAWSASVLAGRVKSPGNDEEMAPTGKGWGEHVDAQAHRQSKSSGPNGIQYHGGPVLLNTPNVYLIWYGNWTGNSATTILPNFVSSIGGSPYFGINTTYFDSAKRAVSGNATLAGQFSTGYTQGTTLSDAKVQQVVSDAITTGNLPGDTNAVYFVLTSADVNESSGSARSTAAGTRTGRSRGSTSSTLSWATPTAARAPARSRPRAARTAIRAPTV